MQDDRSTFPERGSPLTRKGSRSAEASAKSLVAVAIPREEARVTNHRGEDRIPGVIKEAVLRFRRRRSTVPVINVSSRGLMIASDLPLRIGEVLELELADKNRTRSIVRWIREGRIGLEFLDETIVWDYSRPQPQVEAPAPQPQIDEPAAEEAPTEQQNNTERFRPARYALMRMGNLYLSGMSIPVRLRNVSTGGAKVESEEELAPGSMVELHLGAAGVVIAEVRWFKEGQVGLRFQHDIEVESLTSGERPKSAPSTTMLKPDYLESELSPTSPWAARFERLTRRELWK